MKKLAIALLLGTSTMVSAGAMDFARGLQYSVGASATQQNFKIAYDSPRTTEKAEKSGSGDTAFTVDFSVRKEFMSCTTAGVLLSLTSRTSHADYWDNSNVRQKMILDNDFGYYATLGRRFNIMKSAEGHLSLLLGGRSMKVKGEQRNNTTGQRWNFVGRTNHSFSFGLNFELSIAKSKFRPFIRWTHTGEVKTKYSTIGSTVRDERLRSKLNTFYLGARYAF